MRVLRHLPCVLAGALFFLRSIRFRFFSFIQWLCKLLFWNNFVGVYFVFGLVSDVIPFFIVYSKLTLFIVALPTRHLNGCAHRSESFRSSFDMLNNVGFVCAVLGRPRLILTCTPLLYARLFVAENAYCIWETKTAYASCIARATWPH